MKRLMGILDPGREEFTNRPIIKSIQSLLSTNKANDEGIATTWRIMWQIHATSC
jgi:hypothetical protein